MKCLVIRTLAMCVILLVGRSSMAQLTTIDSAKQALVKVNRTFDSSMYLAFNVTMTYDTDTLFGQFEHSEVFGNYILNNRNMYFKLDKNEFVQTDSFVYNIDNESRILTMTKDPAVNSTQFPIKEFVDSIMKWYDTAYIITIRTVDSTDKLIEFKGKHSYLPYTKFSIRYQAGSYRPVQLDMETLGQFDLSAIPDSLLNRVKVKPMHRRMVIVFSDYMYVNDISVFNDLNYTTYDREKRYYKLTPKYRGYRFYTSGVEGDDTDETPEMIAPPVGEGSPY